MSEQLSFAAPAAPEIELRVVNLIREAIDPALCRLLDIRHQPSKAETNTPTNSIVVSADKSDLRPAPSASALICNIKSTGKTQYVRFRQAYERDFADRGLPIEAESSRTFFRIGLEAFVAFLETDKSAGELLEKIIADSLALEAFSCCSRFRECSRAGKCVQDDLVFGLGCAYRKNLMEGRVFYVTPASAEETLEFVSGSSDTSSTGDAEARP